MSPVMRKTWIEVIYWDCGNPDHRHKKESVAEKCISKNANKKMPNPLDVKRARWIFAARSVILGETYKDAGAKIGVSESRCRQLVYRVMRMSLNPKYITSQFPEHNYWIIKEARAYRDFWLTQIRAIQNEWGL